MKGHGAFRGFAATAAALVVLCILCVARLAAAARDPAQEARIERDVAAVDPALVADLHAGNEATDRGDDAAAAVAYAKVHEKAPHVVAVTRRLGTAEARSGHAADGVAHCREALAAEASAENHAALAMALAAVHPFGLAESDEAAAEARAAATIAPSAAFAQTTLCEIAALRGDGATLDACSATLRAIAPSAPGTHLFSALALGRKGDIDQAERELDRARAAGLADKTYQSTRAELEAARPTPHPARMALTVTVVAWIGLLFLLFVGGMLLSDASPRSPSKLARALQRAVIVVAAAMFYVSAVIMSAALLGSVVVVVVTFLRMARASRVIDAVVGVVALYVVLAAMRALFTKVPAPDLGEPVDLRKQKALASALSAVAKALRMPKIGAVYVRPDARIEVTERGGPFGHLRDKNERALSIGVAALDGLEKRQLQALVASELARYRGRGGAGGDTAIVERASVDALLERMDERGVAMGANPAWWFTRLYRAFFERISEGAVDLQDDLADRRAAEAFGGDALVSGLRHVARREVELGGRARGSIRAVLDGGEVKNVYTRDVDGDVRGEVDAAIAELDDRIKRIDALEVEGAVEDEDEDEPAWKLFSDREALEQAMTDRLRRDLQARAGFGAAQESSESSVARA